MLTDRGIKTLKHREKEYSISDRDGLSIRVFPNGRKSFQYRYKLPGWKYYRRYTYGDYPDLSLREARDKHAKAKKQVQNGINLNLEKKIAISKQVAAQTVSEAYDEHDSLYLSRQLKQPGRQRQYFEKDVLPEIGEMKVKDVTSRHLIAILDSIVGRNAPIQANRTLSALKRFFNFCVERGILDYNPAAQISRSAAGGKETPKDRFLSESEIELFWKKIDTAKFSKQVQLILKILFLTGQRVGEVVAAEWDEIDLQNNIWTIPKEKSKNSNENRVPLNGMTIKCFNELKKLSYYYSAEGEPKQSRYCCQSPQQMRETPRDKKSKYTTPERAIQRVTIGRAIQRHQEYFGINKWTPHDIRRTLSTHLNEMGILPHVVEKILNHKMQGVMAVYNKAEYWGEKVEALNRWQEKIKQIIAGEKIIPIKQKTG